jgi:hypothetical protein
VDLDLAFHQWSDEKIDPGRSKPTPDKHEVGVELATKGTKPVESGSFQATIARRERQSTTSESCRDAISTRRALI